MNTESIELCLAITSEEDFLGKSIEAYKERLVENGQSGTDVDAFLRLLDERGDMQVTHLKIGNDFCEHLIPADALLDRCLQICADEGIALVVATPPVTDYGLGKVRKILKRLSGAKSDIEVIFNDFGVLGLLESEFGEFAPIAGRTIVKLPYDPRQKGCEGSLMRRTANSAFSKGIEEPIRRGWISFLSSQGVRAIEQDLLHFEENFSEDRNRKSLFAYLDKASIRLHAVVPFSFATFGRICQYRGLGKPLKDKLIVDPTPCDCSCRHMCTVLTPASSPSVSDADASTFLLQKGNAIFGVNRLSEYDLSNCSRVTIETLPFNG